MTRGDLTRDLLGRAPAFIRLLHEVAGAPQGGGGQAASNQRRAGEGGESWRATLGSAPDGVRHWPEGLTALLSLMASTWD